MRFGLFLAVLLLEVLGVAVVWPSAIGSSFFGPTAIAVAVAMALAADRLVSWARRPGPRDETDERGGGHAGRTLH